MTSSKSSCHPLRAAGWLIVFTLLIVNAASATYPGQNGRIAFVAHFTGTWQLYSVKPDGSDLFQITNLPPTEFPFWFPDYSPDGKQLVFCHDMSGAVELYTINTDGSGLTQVTHDEAENIFPRWSPDGTHILFSTLFNGDFGYHHLATIRADGSERTVLTSVLFDDYQAEYTVITRPALKASGPDVSPDGQHMVFYDHQNTDVIGETWVGRTDGTQLRKVTRNLGAGNPSFAPDGSKIVFNDRSGNLLTMNADGSDVQTILSCAEGCALPDWGAKAP